MTHAVRWVAWNLFLAVIPVVLGYAGAWLLGRGKRPRLLAWLGVPVLLVWLAFLPNTCYLLTEWRHLLFDPRWAGLLDAGREDRGAMLSTAKVALFFLAYSGAGVLLFALAIRPIEGWLRARKVRFFLAAPFLFFLTSLGVYLGLIVRLNSWDLWHRPRFVWQTTENALTSPTLFMSIVIFALILWALYEAVDLWVDGVSARLRRWGLRSAGAPARAV